jgi:hypothetical protein
MSQLEVDKIIPQSGTTLTIGDSGDTITISAGATLSGSLNADNLTSGTVPDARITGAYTNLTGLTVDGDVTFKKDDGTTLILENSTNTSYVGDGTELQGAIHFKNRDSSGDDDHIGAKIESYVSNATGSGNLEFHTGRSETGSDILKRMDIALDGDISFYEDTGTTAKFKWDSSLERLGIGTDNPLQTLDVVGSIRVSEGLFIAGSGNKLDDYEEGNVDSLGFETTNSDINVTLDRNRGKYVKIGKQVNVTGVLRTSAVTSKGTGTLIVTGLPFTVDNTYQRGEATGVFNGYYRWVNSPALCVAINNTTTLELRRNSGSSSTTLTPSSDLWDLSYPCNWCTFTITYYTT